MTLFLASGIDWDTDGEDPASLGLPDAVEVEAEDEDGVVDALSDNYGWCINGVTAVYEIYQP